MDYSDIYEPADYTLLVLSKVNNSGVKYYFIDQMYISKRAFEYGNVEKDMKEEALKIVLPEAFDSLSNMEKISYRIYYKRLKEIMCLK